MSDTSTWLTVLCSLLGGGVIGHVSTAWAKRGKAREETAQAREASATAVVPQLQDFITQLNTEAQRLREEMKKAIEESDEHTKKAIKESDDRCERLRKEDREACAKETAAAVERATAPLRKELVKLAHEARRTRRDLVGREDTGVQMLDQIVKRVSKSDPELRAAPFEPETRPDTPKAIARLPIARREIPPPKRRGGR